MLVENKPSLTGEVVTIKLTTGEEIIARCTYHYHDSNNPSAVSIKNPLAMVMMPSDDGQQGMVAFAPWVLGLEDNEKIDIKPDHIVVLVKARQDAAVQYMDAVGEVVETPTPKLAPQMLTGARKGGRGR